ncbi:MAG TPA: hypothetical protein VGN74_05620 [Brevundimonas sp.]|jgi:hypothetical protein|uniref:hypothetical protein n=1 Tax=Brevundimonas sp. TaxID=1871086 RepID=UPI002E0FCDF8|nr:hypothetical protein [Brevundimonas sp.]
MATSKIEIIKRAASITGNGALVSIDDNEEVARLTDEHYEAIVEEMLCEHTWPWARRAVAMTAIEFTPERPWRKAWGKPVGLLALTYVQDANGLRVDHEERDTDTMAAVLTMVEDDVVYALGTYRVDEDRWSADFAMAVQKRMEAVFRKAIAEQTTEGNRDEQAGMAKAQKARVRSQRSSTSPDASEWDLTRARMRSRSWDIGR